MTNETNREPGDVRPVEWNDTTWNPVRGCTKVSPGCDNCYAARMASRWRGAPGHPYELGFDPREVPDNLDQPLRWKRPRRILVASMGDLFHEEIDPGFVRQVFETMLVAQWHVYQVLTKRPERMRKLVRGLPRELADQPHIWMGVSVEDRAHGLPRIDVLRDVPAAVRFVCVEPLLEDLGAIDLSGIHSVVVGGESGQGARPMRAEWVHAIRRQCEAQGVAFFFKGWGGARRELTGRLLDGRTWDELPALGDTAAESPWPA